MIDFYKVAPVRGLKATRDEYEALVDALYPAGEDDEFEDDECHMFEVEYSNGEVYVFAPEYGDWRALPHAFLTLLGTLIAKNGLEYLEFCLETLTWDPRSGIGDGCFRVRSNGSLWEPTLSW